jgi:hypothetical protein
LFLSTVVFLFAADLFVCADMSINHFQKQINTSETKVDFGATKVNTKCKKGLAMPF